MEQLLYSFDARNHVKRSAFAGVVGSGNLEILMEPGKSGRAEVEITTSLEGNGEIWKYILERVFEEHPVCVHVEINDFGATPGVVQLRLLQVLEIAEEREGEAKTDEN